MYGKSDRIKGLRREVKNGFIYERLGLVDEFQLQRATDSAFNGNDG